MGSMSIWHWLILGIIVLVVFGGRGKISDIMGDVAKGMKAFKNGMKDDETPAVQPVKNIDGQPSVPLNSTEHTKAG
jgi:sec-independent protein translocase protein TatA